MKHSIIIILFSIFLPKIAFSQDFGCYNITAIDYTFSRNPILAPSFEKFFYKTDWSEFSLDSNVTDGFYKKYYFNESSCSTEVKMEGFVKNGLQEGSWILYLSKKNFYKGYFINGKKEGLWVGYHINEKEDSICLSEIKFENNLYNGITKLYSLNGNLYKIINYQNGQIDGQEIEYVTDDSTNVKRIQSLKEYTNGKLDGKYLIYKWRTPFDTLTYGKYSAGKKNGRFIFIDYDGKKTIVDYVNDKVEGKFIKYHRNGVLAYELDYKNNLPYNLIQLQDTSGNKIDSNLLSEGTGKLNFYDDNGILLSSFEYKDQLIAGEFCTYYETGVIKEQGLLYTNNEKCFKQTTPIEDCYDFNLFAAWQLNFTNETNYTVFNEDGSIIAKYHSVYNDSIKDDINLYEVFKKGKLLSTETFWRGLQFSQINKYYEDGTIKMTGSYIILNNDTTKTSVKNGVFKYYHTNGILNAEVNYLLGNETGKSYFYDDSGNLKRIKVIEPNGAIYNIFENDTVNKIDEKGRKQGKWIRIPHSISEDYCFYIPNQIKYYNNDKPIGIWEFYSNDGKCLTKRIVWQDSLNTYCQRWFYKGKLQEEGYMINNKEVGEWKEYDYKKGYLKFKGQYNCGQKTGIWQEFNKKGEIIKEIEYPIRQDTIFPERGNFYKL